MYILVLNGSPRHDGNTRTALNDIMEGIQANISGAVVECIDVSKKKLSCCMHCDGCKKNGGSCVRPDESAEIVQKIADADTIILGTPVYWWGMSSQLKMTLDKMYSKTAELQTLKKRLGLVVAGYADTTDPQYRLIREQMECASQFLGWDMVFSESLSTPEKTTLAGDTAKRAALKELWKKLI